MSTETQTLIQFLKLHTEERNCVLWVQRKREKKDIFSIIIAVIIQFHFSGSVIRIFQILIESEHWLWISKALTEFCEVRMKKKTEKPYLFEWISFWTKSPNRCMCVCMWVAVMVNKTTKILWNDQAFAYLFHLNAGSVRFCLNKIAAATSHCNNINNSSNNSHSHIITPTKLRSSINDDDDDGNSRRSHFSLLHSNEPSN